MALSPQKAVRTQDETNRTCPPRPRLRNGTRERAEPCLSLPRAGLVQVTATGPGAWPRSRERRGRQGGALWLLRCSPVIRIDQSSQAWVPHIREMTAPLSKNKRRGTEKGSVLSSASLPSRLGQENQKSSPGPKCQHMRPGELAFPAVTQKLCSQQSATPNPALATGKHKTPGEILLSSSRSS